MKTRIQLLLATLILCAATWAVVDAAPTATTRSAQDTPSVQLMSPTDAVPTVPVDTTRPTDTEPSTPAPAPSTSTNADTSTAPEVQPNKQADPATTPGLTYIGNGTYVGGSPQATFTMDGDN